MSKLKQAAVAATCAAGLTLGAFAMATPALASVAVYDCYDQTGHHWGEVEAETTQSGTQVTVQADIAAFSAPGGVPVTGTVNWTPSPSVPISGTTPTIGTVLVLTGTYGGTIPSTAPDSFVISVPNASPPPSTLIITCTKVP